MSLPSLGPSVSREPSQILRCSWEGTARQWPDEPVTGTCWAGCPAPSSAVVSIYSVPIRQTLVWVHNALLQDWCQLLRLHCWDSPPIILRLPAIIDPPSSLCIITTCEFYEVKPKTRLQSVLICKCKLGVSLAAVMQRRLSNSEVVLQFPTFTQVVLGYQSSALYRSSSSHFCNFDSVTISSKFVNLRRLIAFPLEHDTDLNTSDSRHSQGLQSTSDRTSVFFSQSQNLILQSNEGE